MNGILNTKAFPDKGHLQAFWLRPIRRVIEQTGISLSSVLRHKSRKATDNRGFNSIRKTNQRNVCIPSLVDTDILDVPPPSDTSDSATDTPTSFESLEMDLLLSNHYKAIPFSSLTHTPKEEIFQSPFQDEPQNVFPINPPPCDSVHRGHPNQEDDDKHTIPHQPHVNSSLSSLVCVCPRRSETILEVPNDESDDDMSLTSSASSLAEHRVLFSPTSELFLRTLAMERMYALHMSEWSSSRAESLRDTTNTIATPFLFFPRLSLNHRLGLLVLGLLLLKCSGTVQQVIAALEIESQQFSMVFFRRLFRSERTTLTTPDLFYNIRNEPIGVWIG
jgi:hypothetical protein